MPVGPSILWPVNATKSAPSFATLTGQCGTLCDASTSTFEPASWAARAMSSTGLIVPSTFEMCTTPVSLTRPSASSFGSGSRSSSPSPVTGMKRSSTPRSAARMCHGTRFEWCSMCVSRMQSPASRFARAHE